MTPLQFAGLSDVGLHHHENQDRWYCDPALGVAFVSDGMGEATTPQFVLEKLPPMLKEIFPAGANLEPQEVITGVRRVIADLNRRVGREARARGDVTGATLVLLVARGERALFAHLGDSRAYRWREQGLEPLTIDHSRLRHMLAQGWITLEEAGRSRDNGGPTRYLGMPGDAQADVQIHALLPGDRLLLCSDGLIEKLGDSDLQSLLSKAATSQEACQRLISAALEAGGHDNITAVVVIAEEEYLPIDEAELLP